jgi:hypothetical protein
MNIKHTLKNLPRAPSSDSVVVSDIKNIIAKTVCFMETTMADIRFILIIVAKNGRIYVLARNDLIQPFYFIQDGNERVNEPCHRRRGLCRELMLHPCASRQ